VTAFQEELLKLGISSTVRVRRGIDIKAGCGQLRDRLMAGLGNAIQENPDKQQ
jgi:adenine C2-methylase RlmN of 23S rRNA A2503 and tRNA A37